MTRAATSSVLREIWLAIEISRLVEVENRVRWRVKQLRCHKRGGSLPSMVAEIEIKRLTKRKSNTKKSKKVVQRTRLGRREQAR